MRGTLTARDTAVRARKRNLLPSVEFLCQIILNACIDFHTLIKYLLRACSVSWTGYTVCDKKDKMIPALTEQRSQNYPVF